MLPEVGNRLKGGKMIEEKIIDELLTKSGFSAAEMTNLVKTYGGGSMQEGPKKLIRYYSTAVPIAKKKGTIAGIVAGGAIGAVVTGIIIYFYIKKSDVEKEHEKLGQELVETIKEQSNCPESNEDAEVTDESYESEGEKQNDQR